MTGSASVEKYAMRAVVILKGTGSTGKSSTLRELIKMLLSLPGVSVIEDDCPSGVTDFWNSDFDGFIVVDVNGKRVGCITEGDPGSEERAKNYRQRCVNLDCDIVVAASRTRYLEGSIYKDTYDFSKQHDACLIETSPFSAPRMNDWGQTYSYDILNVACARGLLDLIMSL